MAGSLYDDMKNREVLDMIAELFGNKGTPRPDLSELKAYPISVVPIDYKGGSDIRDVNAFDLPDYDFDVGSYDPKRGIRVAKHFPDTGEKIPARYKNYITAHERGHAEGLDEIDTAMLAEYIADPGLWIRTMGRRAAYAKTGEKSKDAEIYRGAVKRYGNTELAGLLRMASSFGDELLKRRVFN